MQLGDFSDLFGKEGDKDTFDSHEESKQLFLDLCEQYSFNMTSPHTIFVPPLKYLQNIRCLNDFVYIYAIHVCNSQVLLSDTKSVMQVKMRSSLVYAIYFYESMWKIGPVTVEKINCVSNNHTMHCLDAILPDLTFERIDAFPLTLLAHETMRLSVLCDLESIQNTYSVNYTFRTFSDRTILSNQTIPFKSSTQILDVTVPHVDQQETVNFWIQLVLNELSLPIISWMRVENIVIFPNLAMETQPEIFDCNPLEVRKNKAFWIDGRGFDTRNVRVSIGDQNATVFACTPTLIKCIMPNLGSTPGKFWVQVANSLVFVTFDRQIVYSA
jgi:hypothetical protein